MSVITKLKTKLGQTTPEPVAKKRKRRFKSRPNATGQQNRELVMELVKEKGGTVNFKDVMALGIKESSSYAYLTALVKEHKLKIDDSTNPRTYCLLEVDTDNQYDQRVKSIVDFAAEHAHETYSIDHMARELSIPNSTTHKMVKNLLKKNVLKPGFNHGGKSVPEKQESEVAADPLFGQIEFLIWTFVRETRTTDALAFLTWLEARSK